jgi:hypothetical protein
MLLQSIFITLTLNELFFFDHSLDKAQDIKFSIFIFK